MSPDGQQVILALAGVTMSIDVATGESTRLAGIVTLPGWQRLAPCDPPILPPEAGVRPASGRVRPSELDERHRGDPDARQDGAGQLVALDALAQEHRDDDRHYPDL